MGVGAKGKASEFLRKGSTWKAAATKKNRGALDASTKHPAAAFRRQWGCRLVPGKLETRRNHL